MLTKSARTLIDIAVGYVLLIPATIFYFYGTAENILIYVTFLILLSIFNSLVFHYLTLFIHAAAHFNLYPKNRFLNDFFSNILVGYIFCLPMSVYRKKHFAHHRHLGSGEDPEDSYQYQISFKNFICWSFLIFPLKKFYYLYFFSPVLNTTAASTKKNYEKIICISVVITIHILCVFFSFPNIEKYIFLLFIPQIMLLPVWNWLRTAAEHRAEITSGETHVLRNFKLDFLGFFLGAAGFRYHDVHHTNPTIHYSELSNHIDIVDRPLKPTSYFEVFKKLSR